MPWAGIISFMTSLTLASGVLYLNQNKVFAQPAFDPPDIISPVAIGFIPFSPSPHPTFLPTPTASPTSLLKPIQSSPKPSPSLKPTPSPISAEQFENWFTQYAGQYSVNRELLKKIAVCESNLNPNARFLDYGGLYQFSVSSWNSTRQTMNYNTDADLRFNAEESIRTAAFRLSTSGSDAWPNCSK